MFDFVTKLDYSSAVGLFRGRVRGGPTWHLKSVQDAIVLKHVFNVRDRTIAEIGGGASRLLPFLARSNSCVSIDPLDGRDGGPDGSAAAGVPTIRAVVGEFSPELGRYQADVLFSISVVEHVPSPNLVHFWDEQLMRLARPGALVVHLIDYYVGCGTEAWEHAQSERLDLYRYPFDVGMLEPFDPDRMIGSGGAAPTFDPAWATNSDNAQLAWRELIPHHAGVLMSAQTCTLALIGWRFDS